LLFLIYYIKKMITKKKKKKLLIFLFQKSIKLKKNFLFKIIKITSTRKKINSKEKMKIFINR
jgi:hypothetical protein